MDEINNKNEEDSYKNSPTNFKKTLIVEKTILREISEESDENAPSNENSISIKMTKENLVLFNKTKNLIRPTSALSNKRPENKKKERYYKPMSLTKEINNNNIKNEEDKYETKNLFRKKINNNALLNKPKSQKNIFNISQKSLKSITKNYQSNNLSLRSRNFKKSSLEQTNSDLNSKKQNLSNLVSKENLNKITLKFDKNSSSCKNYSNISFNYKIHKEVLPKFTNIKFENDLLNTQNSCNKLSTILKSLKKFSDFKFEKTEIPLIEKKSKSTKFYRKCILSKKTKITIFPRNLNKIDKPFNSSNTNFLKKNYLNEYNKIILNPIKNHCLYRNFLNSYSNDLNSEKFDLDNFYRTQQYKSNITNLKEKNYIGNNLADVNNK